MQRYVIQAVISDCFTSLTDGGRNRTIRNDEGLVQYEYYYDEDDMIVSYEYKYPDGSIETLPQRKLDENGAFIKKTEPMQDI